MWRRSKKPEPEPKPEDRGPGRLSEAIRRARLEDAERTSVVVDLRDAELARLELLNDALNPLFAEIPADIDLFDRGVSPGDTPRLWIDAVAHVAMGRDKRIYRFLLDTRYGRTILAESPHTEEIVEAVALYVARRMIERERTLAGEPPPGFFYKRIEMASERRRRHWRTAGRWLLRAGVAIAFLFLLVWFLATV